MTVPPHDRLRALLADVQRGALDIDAAMQALTPSADLGFATVDHDRNRRCGLPEVVFCQGKTATDAAAIAREIVAPSGRVLMTRADAAHADAVREALPKIQATLPEGTQEINISG
jgi:NCAIR mutase (PurE)-related protein